jgi:hypothetical protein
MSDQLYLFEPDTRESLLLLSHHQKVHASALKAAELWELRLCPGAAKEARAQAQVAFMSFFHLACYLDLQAELETDESEPGHRRNDGGQAIGSEVSTSVPHGNHGDNNYTAQAVAQP